MVRPVELQDVFAKTQAAERVTELQRMQPENQQRQAAADTSRNAEADQRKPVQSKKTDEVIIHKEAEKKDPKDKKNSKADHTDDDTQDQDQDGETADATPDASKGGDDQQADEPPPTHFDVRV